VRGANELGRALFSELYAVSARPVNNARFVFLDPRAEAFYRDWDRAADDTVAILRWAAGHDPYDRDLSDLVGELATQSHAFRTRWAQHNVRFHNTAIKQFHHPVVGDLDLSRIRWPSTSIIGWLRANQPQERATPAPDVHGRSTGKNRDCRRYCGCRSAVLQATADARFPGLSSGTAADLDAPAPTATLGSLDRPPARSNPRPNVRRAPPHDRGMRRHLPPGMRANRRFPWSSVGQVVTVGEARHAGGRGFESRRSRFRTPRSCWRSCWLSRSCLSRRRPRATAAGDVRGLASVRLKVRDRRVTCVVPWIQHLGFDWSG
jgi:hypothetical protein